MKQYMLSVHHDSQADFDGANLEPGDMERMFAQVSAFNTAAMDAGIWVFGGGLTAPDTATTVRPSDGDVLITDGPFAETKEFLGGFWVIKAEDLDDALAWGKRAALACEGAVEVRPFQDEPEG